MKQIESKNKQEVRRHKDAAREKLTNWYMINMTWGFVGILALVFIMNAYNAVRIWPAEHTLGANITLWILAGLFAIGGGALFSLWLKNNKAKDRFLGGAKLAWILSVVTILFVFAPQIGGAIAPTLRAADGTPIVMGHSSVLVMNVVMFNAAVMFALFGAVLFYLWLRSGKTKQRRFNYAIFTWITAAAAFFLAFWQPIQAWLRRVGVPSLFFEPAPARFIHGFMALIGLWLVVALVWYIIKYRKI